ncbi:MAG: hypothetical protein ACRDPA_34110 [Solirubrobacteraceae bacterium]
MTPTKRPITHQTVRLSAGSHASPAEGVCVMELASMLAGEPFSAAPNAVCPVIAAFLRTYNDRVDDRRRQDLYGYAAEAIGTRSTREVERARAKLCHRWAGKLQRRRLRHQPPLGPPPPSTPPAIVELLWLHRPERAGRRAALAAAHDTYEGPHRATLRFVDELIAVRGSSPGELPDWFAEPESVARTPQWPDTSVSTSRR